MLLQVNAKVVIPIDYSQSRILNTDSVVVMAICGPEAPAEWCPQPKDLRQWNTRVRDKRAFSEMEWKPLISAEYWCDPDSADDEWLRMMLES
ncbi:MAG: hypothetical protein ACJ8CB_24045 [Ktedonobacteraceae bacterium]